MVLGLGEKGGTVMGCKSLPSPVTDKPHDQFDVIRDGWLQLHSLVLERLKSLDGDTTRQIGGIVEKIVQDGPSKHLWPDTGCALFLRRDPDFWHELANSRKE
jgi:hypothetical protein